MRVRVSDLEKGDENMEKNENMTIDIDKMSREEIIGLLQKEMEKNCQLLNDKRRSYVEACKAEWSIRKKSELFKALPAELRYSEGNEFFNDVLDTPNAIEVMQYICDCISQNVPPYQEYDNMTGMFKNVITKDECKKFYHFTEGTFEDACDMFVSTDIDAMIKKRVIIYDKGNLHSKLFITGLRRMWDEIKENTDGNAGLRALFS